MDPRKRKVIIKIPTSDELVVERRQAIQDELIIGTSSLPPSLILIKSGNIRDGNIKLLYEPKT